jgi:hypothetical protein
VHKNIFEKESKLKLLREHIAELEANKMKLRQEFKDPRTPLFDSIIMYFAYFFNLKNNKNSFCPFKTSIVSNFLINALKDK